MVSNLAVLWVRSSDGVSKVILVSRRWWSDPQFLLLVVPVTGYLVSAKFTQVRLRVVGLAF